MFGLIQVSKTGAGSTVAEAMSSLLDIYREVVF